ncbi:MAG TPA: carboxypeptidase-like regulatory domain-containing protein [Pyrinomonadaceae bacterium]
MNLIPLAAPAAAQTFKPTLRLGEVNVLRVGQLLPVVLVDPASGKKLNLAQYNLVSSDESVLLVVGGTLTALQPSAGNVQLRVRTKARRPVTVQHYDIRVVAQPATSPVASITLLFDPPSAQVQPGGLLRVTAVPRDSTGVALDKANVRWTLEDFDAGNYIEWAVKPNNQLLIFGKPPAAGAAAASRPNRLLLTASYGGAHRKGYVELGRNPAGGQGGPYVISGQITGDGNDPKEVTVSLQERGSKTSTVTKSATDGTFKFDNLDPGKVYTVSLSKDKVAFAPASKEFPALDSNIYSNFQARPEAEPPPIETPFKAVRSQLDNVDERTSRDLFGKVTYDKYHITKLQLFNTLHTLQNGRVVGDSVVVYSDSIKVPVNLEVRYIGPEKGKAAIGSLRPVSLDRMQWHPKGLEIASDADLSQPLKWEKWPSQKRREPRRYGADPNAQTIDGLCRDEPTYRSPYTFDQMLRTVDERDSRDLRTRIVAAATGGSTLASFIMSVIGTGDGGTGRTFVQNFEGLFIPSLKEHFPSRKEKNRESLTREVMRQSETIPFKQDLSRIIFLPKDSWRNGEYEERISRICLEPVEVQAVVAKPEDQLPINTLLGTVMDDTDRLLANATVEITSPFTSDSTTTADNGVFTFQRLAPGPYLITVTTSCGVKVTRSITVASGPQPDVKIDKVPSRLIISGKVTDSGGGAVKDAAIDLKNAAGAVVRSARSGPDGTYVLECVPKAAYTMSITHPQHSFDDKSVAELTADLTANLTAKPPPPAAPSGTTETSPPTTTPTPAPTPSPETPEEPTTTPTPPSDAAREDVAVASETRAAPPPRVEPAPAARPVRIGRRTQLARKRP